jgi:hypothetical protein
VKGDKTSHPLLQMGRSILKGVGIDLSLKSVQKWLRPSPHWYFKSISIRLQWVIGIIEKQQEAEHTSWLFLDRRLQSQDLDFGVSQR